MSDQSPIKNMETDEDFTESQPRSQSTESPSAGSDVMDTQGVPQICVTSATEMQQETTSEEPKDMDTDPDPVESDSKPEPTESEEDSTPPLSDEKKSNPEEGDTEGSPEPISDSCTISKKRRTRGGRGNVKSPDSTSNEAKGMESDGDSDENISKSDAKPQKSDTPPLSYQEKAEGVSDEIAAQSGTEPVISKDSPSKEQLPVAEIKANPPQSISDENSSIYPDSASSATLDRTTMPQVTFPLDTVSPYIDPLSSDHSEDNTCSDVTASLPTDTDFRKPPGGLRYQPPFPEEPYTEPIKVALPMLFPVTGASDMDVTSISSDISINQLRKLNAMRVVNPTSLQSCLTDPSSPMIPMPPPSPIKKKSRESKSYPPPSVAPIAPTPSTEQAGLPLPEPPRRSSTDTVMSFSDVSEMDMTDPFTPDPKSDKTHTIPDFGAVSHPLPLKDTSQSCSPPDSNIPLEDTESEDRFAGYKGVRDITIKKGPSGLGLMIIEGRHAEAGRGIFVSDLQEGSAAEQAGLQIGDMILAVNRDSLLRCSYDAAAAKLKHTEGAVKLTVCTPNLKDKKEDAPLAEETGSATTSVPAGSAASRSASGNQTPDPGLAAAGSSRPHSPRPAPSPVRTEPPADPATAPIQPNQDTIIEITTESQNLGLFLLGGSDTSINGPAAVVLDVIQDRPVGRDGRLQRGDQIRAACGIQLTEAMTEDRLNMTIKQWAPKLKFTVFRPDPIQYEDIEVDVNRKQKPLGFSFAAFSNDRGIYITQILPGSPAEQDGRLRRGDHILTVDGKDVSSAEFTAASVALKLIGPKVSIKIRRLKIVR